MNVFINDVIESLNTYQDLERKELAKGYHPTSMKIIGVTNPNIKKIIKELRHITGSYTPRKKIDLAKSLLNTGIFECQQIAYEFLGKDKSVQMEITEKDVDDLNQNLDNWVSVDSFSIFISGKAWRNGIISNAKIKNYLNSNNHWIRRIALVSTVPLNLKSQGGKGDTKKTLEICSLAVHDHNDMIVKALSWALRELSKSDKTSVELFLEKYEEKLHTLVKREVRNKLLTGRKNPF